MFSQESDSTWGPVLQLPGDTLTPAPKAGPLCSRSWMWMSAADTKGQLGTLGPSSAVLCLPFPRPPGDTVNSFTACSLHGIMFKLRWCTLHHETSQHPHPKENPSPQREPHAHCHLPLPQPTSPPTHLLPGFHYPAVHVSGIIRDLWLAITQLIHGVAHVIPFNS